MPNAAGNHTVREHFEKCSDDVAAIYAKIIDGSKKLGTVSEDPKKTSIHLVRKTAFAGVATRKNALILTLKSDADVKSGRVIKREQVSAHRWHVEFRLETPKQVDKELLGWLRDSYDLSG